MNRLGFFRGIPFLLLSARFLLAGLIIAFSLYSSAGVQATGKQPQALASGVQLIMFEQEGCHYCEVWNENIGGSYHKTAEGKFAPLRRVDIHTDADVANVKPVVFTPTFVLYKDQQEVGRLTGYISDDFFWGLLEPLLKKHGYGKKVRESSATRLKKQLN